MPKSSSNSNKLKTGSSPYPLYINRPDMPSDNTYIPQPARWENVPVNRTIFNGVPPVNPVIASTDNSLAAQRSRDIGNAAYEKEHRHRIQYSDKTKKAFNNIVDATDVALFAMPVGAGIGAGIKYGANAVKRTLTKSALRDFEKQNIINPNEIVIPLKNKIVKNKKPSKIYEEIDYPESSRLSVNGNEKELEESGKKFFINWFDKRDPSFKTQYEITGQLRNLKGVKVYNAKKYKEEFLKKYKGLKNTDIPMDEQDLYQYIIRKEILNSVNRYKTQAFFYPTTTEFKEGIILNVPNHKLEGLRYKQYISDLIHENAHALKISEREQKIIDDIMEEAWQKYPKTGPFRPKAYKELNAEYANYLQINDEVHSRMWETRKNLELNPRKKRYTIKDSEKLSQKEEKLVKEGKLLMQRDFLNLLKGATFAVRFIQILLITQHA